MNCQKEYSEVKPEKDPLSYYKKSMNWLRKKEIKAKLLKERKEHAEINRCSFAPRTNIHNKTKSCSNVSKRQDSEFYKRNKEWQEKKEKNQELLKEEKQQKENLEMKPEKKAQPPVYDHKRYNSSCISKRTRRKSNTNLDNSNTEESK